MSVEANQECEKRINSVGYFVGVDGNMLRVQEKDFLLGAYNLTINDKKIKLEDINKRKEKVSIIQKILYLLIRLLFLIIYSIWVSFSVFFVTYLLYGD